MCLGDVPRQRDQQPDRVLGGGDDRRLRRVRDHDPSPGRLLDVDVVDADSGAADHLQPIGALENVRRQLRGRADHDRVVASDPLSEVAVRLDVDFEAFPQELDPGLGDWLADEDALRHTRARSS